MINNDTIELLKECNAGVKMGVSSIDEVLPSVNNDIILLWQVQKTKALTLNLPRPPLASANSPSSAPS